MATVTFHLTPTTLNTWLSVQLPTLNLASGATYSATWSTVSGATGTLGIAMCEQSGSSWPQVLTIGPNSGVNSINLAGTALSTGWYRCAVYSSLNTECTISITTSGQIMQGMWVMAGGVLHPVNSIGAYAGGNLTLSVAGGVYAGGQLHRTY